MDKIGENILVESSNPIIEMRYILVDTNCFLRLYQSPVLPFLGRTVGNYYLVTLPCLINEFLNGKKLLKKYAWLESTVRAEDLSSIALSLSKKSQAEVDVLVDSHFDYVNSVLAVHCDERKIIERQISAEDCQLLATGIFLNAIIATDEWPMGLVVADLLSVPEDNYRIEIFTSIHILHLFENANLISSKERKATIKSWLQNDEKLKKDWRDLYWELFKEGAPTL
jgi:hypothetical protein